jgi:hypothetical protein
MAGEIGIDARLACIGAKPIRLGTDEFHRGWQSQYGQRTG